jgi:hypothetical protein
MWYFTRRTRFVRWQPRLCTAIAVEIAFNPSIELCAVIASVSFGAQIVQALRLSSTPHLRSVLFLLKLIDGSQGEVCPGDNFGSVLLPEPFWLLPRAAILTYLGGELCLGYTQFRQIKTLKLKQTLLLCMPRYCPSRNRHSGVFRRLTSLTCFSLLLGAMQSQFTPRILRLLVISHPLRLNLPTVSRKTAKWWRGPSFAVRPCSIIRVVRTRVGRLKA